MLRFHILPGPKNSVGAVRVVDDIFPIALDNEHQIRLGLLLFAIGPHFFHLLLPVNQRTLGPIVYFVTLFL